MKWLSFLLFPAADMDIHVQITREKIPAFGPRSTPGGQTGALTEFHGIVRDEENGEAIAALEYEAYEPMAQAQMRQIIQELEPACPCLAVSIIHRLGIIPVGETAIAVRIFSRHRGEGLALAARFMDRLKQDVPIWKVRSIPKTSAVSVAPTAPVASVPGILEIIELVRSQCAPLPTERVPLHLASGRFLREEIRAPEDEPHFDRSSVDGYAIRLDDPALEFTLIDEIRAGEWKPRLLAKGETVRIATGGSLPAEHLKVVMKEDVEVTGGRVRVLRSDSERHIRFRGENARAGDVLVRPGPLRPGTLSLLASVGCTNPLVSRLPRVLHIATGDEIVPPEATPGPAQIRDSDSILVRAFFHAFGIEPRQLRLGEDPTAARDALRAQAGSTDILLISGGASVGEHDFTRQLLVEAGYGIRVSKTRVRPGKPAIFGVTPDGRVAFGLPGNPLAHYICLNLFVRAALDALIGLPPRDILEQADLAEPLLEVENDRETLWPACTCTLSGRRAVRPLRWNNSGDLTCLALANALIFIPPRTKELPAGAQVLFASTEIAQ